MIDTTTDIVATLRLIASHWSGRTRPEGDGDPGEYGVTFCYGDDTVTLYGCCLHIARDAAALLKRPDVEDIVTRVRHHAAHGAWIYVRADAWGGTRIKRFVSEEQRKIAADRLAKTRGAA